MSENPNPIIGIPKITYDRLLKTKNKKDNIILYSFYIYTAAWQKTNQPKCVLKYIQQGLGMNKTRIRKAKNDLRKLGLIQDVNKKGEKGKFDSWYVKINFNLKQSTLPNIDPPPEIREGGIQTPEIREGGAIIQPPPSRNPGVPPLPKSGSTPPPEIREGNTYSTGNNAYSTGSQKDTKVSLRDGSKEPSENSNNHSMGLLDDDPKKLGGIIEPHIKKILRSLNEIGEWNHTFPKPGKPCSKIIKNSIQYLKQIKSGEFKRLSIDKTWAVRYIQKWPDPKGYESWGEVRALVLDSITSFMIDYTNSKKLKGKTWKPASMDQFFYNTPADGTSKSMFLKFLNVSPKSAAEKTADFQKSKIPDYIQEMLKDLLAYFQHPFSGENLLQFWAAANKLQSWYVDNDPDIRKYNEAYNHNSWANVCGTDSAFFDKIIEYLKGNVGGHIPPRVLDPDSGNRYWREFKSLLRQYGIHDILIDIDLDERGMRNADMEIEAGKRQQQEWEIQNKMEDCARKLDGDNIEYTQAELRDWAIREMAEKKEHEKRKYKQREKQDELRRKKVG